MVKQIIVLMFAIEIILNLVMPESAVAEDLVKGDAGSCIPIAHDCTEDRNGNIKCLKPKKEFDLQYKSDQKLKLVRSWLAECQGNYPGSRVGRSSFSGESFGQQQDRQW
ncbi:MAG: hypothetical protein H7837_02900 [Magnetococcus sp. MYC-9]